MNEEPTVVNSNTEADQMADTQEPSTTPSQAEPVGKASSAMPTPDSVARRVTVTDLHAYYGDTHAVKGIGLDFDPNKVTAIIGPSGCGKSTMVRCLNRMHEEIPGARAEGKVMLDDVDVYDPSLDVVAVRRAIGMVFQKPNPFPTMSVFDNVAVGPQAHRPQGQGPQRARREVAARRRAVGRGQGPPEPSPASACPAASSSACASRARSPSSPR